MYHESYHEYKPLDARTRKDRWIMSGKARRRGGQFQYVMEGDGKTPIVGLSYYPTRDFYHASGNKQIKFGRDRAAAIHSSGFGKPSRKAGKSASPKK